MNDEQRAAHAIRTDRPLGLRPGVAVRGRLAVPGSKSIAQRVLVAASLCAGQTRVARLSQADDVRAALTLIEAVGARVKRAAPAAVEISGRPPGPHGGWLPRAPLDAGESATLARFATAALGLCGSSGGRFEIGGRASLLTRTSAALFDALRGAGVVLERPGVEGDAHAAAAADRWIGWPVRIGPIGPPPDVHLHAPQSSQEASALLIALSAYPGESVLHVHGALPSRPYVALTLAVLSDFGVSIDVHATEDGETFVVRGPLEAPGAPIAIEPDASCAAVALAAACMSGGELLVPALTPRARQGDTRILEYLSRMGAHTRIDEEGAFASGAPVRGGDFDLRGEPDLAPVLAALGAGVALGARASADAQACTTRLYGLETLPGKESSRIEVLAHGLRALGLSVEHDRASLVIAAHDARARAAALVLDPRGDHRMAFAFALLGLVREGVRVAQPACVSKSWPSFWDDMRRLGVLADEHSGS